MKQCKVKATSNKFEIRRSSDLAVAMASDPATASLRSQAAELVENVETNVHEAINRVRNAPREVVDCFGTVEVDWEDGSLTDCGPYEVASSVTTSWSKTETSIGKVPGVPECQSQKAGEVCGT